MINVRDTNGDPMSTPEALVQAVAARIGLLQAQQGAPRRPRPRGPARVPVFTH